MTISMKQLAQVAKAVLEEHHDDIYEAIVSVNALDRYTGIEAAFADRFDDYLSGTLNIPVDRRKKTSDIGTLNYFSRQTTVGKVDAVYVEPKGWSAAEYKAVRMPRRKGSYLFDISQISADAQRMRKATKIKRGWVIVFVYGPMVEDSPNDKSLLRDFLGQMYLETKNAVAKGQMEPDDSNYKHTKLMGWHRAPCDGNRPPATAVKFNKLGAIIIECRNVEGA